MRAWRREPVHPQKERTDMNARYSDLTSAELASTGLPVKAAMFVEYARHLALGQGKISDAIHSAETSHASPRVIEALQKQATPGTTTEVVGSPPDTWGGQLAPMADAAQAFVATLSNHGAFDAMVVDMLGAPMNSRFTYVISNPDAAPVAEGAVKPVSEAAFDAGVLTPRKCHSAVVVSAELLRLSNGRGLAALTRALQTAVARSVDSVFFGWLIANPGIAHSPTNDPVVDVGTLLMAVPTDASSRLHFAISSNLAKQIAAQPVHMLPGNTVMTPQGGTLAGVAAHITDATGDDLILVDASKFAAASEALSLRVSTETNVDMGGGNVFSTWQKNCVALGTERWFSFSPLRPDAYAVMAEPVWLPEQS